jgi:nucleoid-associated protein YgaU
MTLAKAKLKWKTIIPPLWGEIDCQFNPTSLSISKTNSWANAQSPAYNAPTSDFQGGQPATYSLSLFFDSYSSDPPKDVRFYTNKLLRLTLRGYGYSMFKVPYSNPPSVTFVWGKITLFKAVVESVNISYTMFAQDGTPIRAKADVTFKQQDYWDDWLPAQNPTSRTDPRRTRVVNSHQRLDLIAHEEYGDSRYWRLLAEANNLDDPFSLQDGQIIVIPDAHV